MTPGDAPPPFAGALGPNLLAFVRLLRRAGLPLGPADAMEASRALTLLDIASRRQVQAGLRATLVRRHDQEEVFDQAFALFWRDPEAAKHAAAMALMDGVKDTSRPPPASRRVAEALQGDRPPPPPKVEEPPPLLEVAMTVSERERLMQMDFEAMGALEIAAAKQEIRKLHLPLDERPTRRFMTHPAGARIDLRATLRESMRTGGEILGLSHKRRVQRPPPLVVLCDISGSMARYAQILLHFLHAVANERDRVSTFLFGTRLSNVTRALKNHDAEVAFEMVSHLVPDWSGGTRIGDALETFNRDWGRRVLGQGAVVLLITDGLDRQGAAGLGEAAARLQRSCRRLIWLNPLLRWEGFQPKSQGARALMPHVHEHRPVHNLNALRDLVASLSSPPPRRSPR